MVKVLVAYSSRYGATRGIAEAIAKSLAEAGLQAESHVVTDVGELSGYDAFVIGSSVYFGHWRKEAVQFVRQNSALLPSRPVWMFSSGPLGTEEKDTQGRDQRVVSEPKDLGELKELIRPRDHRVFFGVLDSGRLGFMHRLLASLPASKATWAVDGDFRDWADIRKWAEGIADNLKGGSPPGGPK